jgi:CRP-like cAMP-binding protein
MKIFLTFAKKNMESDDLFLCPICRNIPGNEQETFLDGLNVKTKVFKKGEKIAWQGDTVTALHILSKGSVKAEMISGAGTVLNIETIHAPNPLAPAFLFAENNRFPVDVTALEDCEIIVVPKDAIMKQLACNEAFLQGFMKYNSNRTHFLSERLKFLSTKTIKGKLAQYILARTTTTDFTLHMSRTALAEYFGVTRPSLSRSLSEMTDEGIISLKGKSGKILQLMKLKDLIVQ